MREEDLRMLEDPDALRERVEQQARAEHEALSLERTGRETQRTREWLAKLDLVEEQLSGPAGGGPHHYGGAAGEARRPR